MTLQVYAMKNRMTGVFERPFCEQVDVKDYPEAITQALSLAPAEALIRHKEFDVYCIGHFDTKTGVIESCVDFVVSLEPICEAYIAYHKNEKSSEDVGKEQTV